MRGVLVVVAVKLFRDRLNANGSQLLDELVRAGNAAEDDGILRRGRSPQATAHAPDIFARG